MGVLTPSPPGLRPLVGMLRLARGRADGLQQFGGTAQAFLSSLAPLLAFPIVGALLLLVSDGPVKASATLLVTLVVQLAPPVLSHALARVWGREEAWVRYATAFNWCQWALPLAAMALLVALQAGMQLGLPEDAADVALLGGLGAYGLWLNWLLARHGLNLSRGRAALLVAATNLGTVLLVAGPGMVAQVLGVD